MGLTVGAVQSGMETSAAQAAFRCDITYVTGQELCFTYLKDNTTQSPEDLVSTAAGCFVELLCAGAVLCILICWLFICELPLLGMMHCDMFLEVVHLRHACCNGAASTIGSIRLTLSRSVANHHCCVFAEGSSRHTELCHR